MAKSTILRGHDALVAKIIELEPILSVEPHPTGNHRWGTVSALDFCKRVLSRGKPHSKSKLLRYLIDHNTTKGYRP